MTVVKEIQAKTLLTGTAHPDTLFGCRYNMNLYRGCEHRCIYCDSRSECYEIEHFDEEVLVKVNAIDLLRDELSRKRIKGPISLGSMNDPFMPLEAEINLAGRALAVIAEFGFPIHIITKSALVLKDLDTLREIARTYASVSFTITTTDDDLAAKVEPGASRPSARLRAMRVLADNGIQTGTTMMPILPFIEDSEENLEAVVSRTAAAGGSYIIPWIGMTTRDRQRAYFYARLDEHFPGIRRKYERTFGDRYECESPVARRLWPFFEDACRRHGVATHIPLYTPQAVKQLRLF
ncbi:MAG: radical SAM protein [Anaerolineae bacterium]|jgi:DNA repair photolyase|nr:radical SAM protein [Anaerolineae bacterium]